MPVTLELSRPDPTEPFSRVDLEFRGVDHSGPSYEACIFFNNPRADTSTPRDEAEGYAGSFHIFGHAGCFGELGHCDVGEGPQALYDHRQPHPLTPHFKTVIVTEPMQRLLQAEQGDTFTVTVVADVRESPAPAGGVEDPLKFESVSLITYQDQSAAGIPLSQERMS